MLTIYAMMQIKSKGTCESNTIYDFRKKENCHELIFNAQFNYCCFIWMLHSCKSNNFKIKHLHGRCLRLIYGDKKSPYEKILEKDNSVSIHHKNIQALALEIFKVKQKLCPEITCDVFMKRIQQSVQFVYPSNFITLQVNNVFHGPTSISYFGPKIWDIVPEKFKHNKSLNNFKEFIKYGYQLIVLADFAKFT